MPVPYNLISIDLNKPVCKKMYLKEEIINETIKRKITTKKQTKK